MGNLFGVLSAICAIANNRVIGLNGSVPWHLPADLRLFRELTWAKPVLMGRTTFESLPHPLPGRENLVLSRQADYAPEGCRVFASLEAALEYTRDVPEVMVIGGASLYAKVLPMVSRQYLSLVDYTCAGDAYYPLFDPNQWELCQIKLHRKQLPHSPYLWRSLILERKAR